MKVLTFAGVGIVLAASMMLGGCGAAATQVPMSPSLANDLLGTTTVSSAPVGPISASTLAPAVWEERDAREPPAATWGAADSDSATK
jgi:hypothetical protein